MIGNDMTLRLLWGATSSYDNGTLTGMLTNGKPLNNGFSQTGHAFAAQLAMTVYVLRDTSDEPRD